MVLIWITSWHTSSTPLPRSCLLILTWTTLSLVYIHFPALRLQGHSEWAWRKIHSLANCLTLNWWLLARGAPHCCSAFKPCFPQAPRWLFHFSLLQANVHHHLPYPQSQLMTSLPNSSREGMKKNQLHRLQASHAYHLLVSVPVNCAFHAVHLEESWDPAYGQPLPTLAKLSCSLAQRHCYNGPLPPGVPLSAHKHAVISRILGWKRTPPQTLSSTPFLCSTSQQDSMSCASSYLQFSFWSPFFAEPTSVTLTILEMFPRSLMTSTLPNPVVKSSPHPIWSFCSTWYRPSLPPPWSLSDTWLPGPLCPPVTLLPL